MSDELKKLDDIVKFFMGNPLFFFKWTREKHLKKKNDNPGRMLNQRKTYRPLYTRRTVGIWYSYEEWLVMEKWRKNHPLNRIGDFSIL